MPLTAWAWSDVASQLVDGLHKLAIFLRLFDVERRVILGSDGDFVELKKNMNFGIGYNHESQPRSWLYCLIQSIHEIK